MNLHRITEQWLRGLSDWSDGAGVLVAALVIAAAAIALPRGERHKLRLAMALAAGHAGALLMRPFVSHGARSSLFLVATFLLLASLARAGFLFVMDGIVTRRLGRAVPQIFRDLLQVTLYVLAGLTTLSTGGVDLSSLLATSALITAVVGLSLQETLGNTLAGVAMQAQPPFQLGDWIEFDGGRIGQVTSVGWRAITLRTNDDVEVSVPNAMLAKAAVTNYSRPTPAVRRTLRLSAPHSEPPHHVEAVLLDAIAGVPGVLSSPPASVVTAGFGDSGMEYQVRYFIDDFQARDTTDSMVRDRIWYAFRRTRIPIPYPTQTLYIHEQTAAQLERESEGRLLERVDALSRVDFLAELPPAALRDLAMGARRKPYAAGELVIEAGQPGNEFYIVRRGEVAVYAGDREIARLGPGQFFGEMSLLTGAPRAATVRTRAPSELIVIHKPSMQEVLESYPAVVERITSVLEARADTLHRTEHPALVIDAEAHRGPLVERIREFFKLA